METLQALIENCRTFLVKRNRLGIITPVDDPGHARATTLRRVANVFADGFALASAGDCGQTKTELETISREERGVGYEGAAASKAVSDLTRLTDLHEATNLLHDSKSYSFLMYLGIGEAMAQLKLPPQLCNSIANEPWSAQVMEGYGFFDGYFNWFESLVRQKYPEGLPPNLADAYDQGLGRAIYFVTNCNPAQIRDYISYYPQARRKELWSGAGVPTAYVGGPSDRELKKLLDYAGTYRAEFMQGVILGASAREKQSFIPNHTEAACNIICGSRAPIAVQFSNDLELLISQRENYTMYSWQELVRNELRKSAC
jgi:hypothetical protein